MQKFNSAGVEIALSDEGQGAAMSADPWLCLKLAGQLAGHGLDQDVAGSRLPGDCIDNRGHGESEKLYDPASLFRHHHG